MNALIISFLSAFLITLLIIRFNHLHQNYSSDWDIYSPQKFHQKIVPRIGGISLVMSLMIAGFIQFKFQIALGADPIYLICLLPTFVIGLAEDLTKKISVNLRLFFTVISAILVIFLIKVEILKFDIPFIDLLFFIPYFGTLITIFAITGLTNAYNIIDGFNGLSSVVAIISLLGIAYVSHLVGDTFIVNQALLMVGALFGFFVWNYPKGLIFLGDGGAYLIGFWIAILSIALTYRHHEISPWFALLINGYPVTETIFTILRRKIHQGKSLGQADAMHIHTLIYRKILLRYQLINPSKANSLTAPYLWALSSVTVIPSMFFWNNTYLLIGIYFLFLCLYIFLYTSIIKFKCK